MRVVDLFFDNFDGCWRWFFLCWLVGIGSLEMVYEGREGVFIK